MIRNSVMCMLEENARRFPEKTALADEYRTMTYREYLEAAVWIAQAIRPELSAQASRGLSCGSGMLPPEAVRCHPVGVLIDRNVLSIAAFMGIAYTGNFYVPLDASLPAGRISMILQELSPLLLVDARQTPGPAPVPVDVPVLDVRSLYEFPTEAAAAACVTADTAATSVADTAATSAAADTAATSAADTAATSSAADTAAASADTAAGASAAPAGASADAGLSALLEKARALREGIVDTDPLYAVFTSGSTGVPKGVLVSHRSLFDLTDAFEEVFGFPEDSVFGNQAPFDYDGSSKDIYNALHCGGRVEVVPHRMFMMPAILMEHLAVRGVNTIIWAVSALRIVADLRALDEVKTSVPLHLRNVMFSGEVMPVKTINYWIRFFPDARFVNLYGPTEITCNCTYYIIDRQFSPDEMLPIGRAFPNTRVFLLERQGTETETAAAGDAGRIIPSTEPDRRGEICVEGTCVALGYWNDPGRTAESFTAKPGACVTLNRIYRTGDLGYYNKEGILCFASRSDNQIKHMSHRIELGEIEAALNAIDFIDVSCCFYDRIRQKIICVYQSKEDRKKEIIKALADRLPKYMRPNKYIHMEQLPLNAHVKIDRRRLRTMYDEGKLK